jgi:hypothetical protein
MNPRSTNSRSGKVLISCYVIITAAFLIIGSVVGGAQASSFYPPCMVLAAQDPVPTPPGLNAVPPGIARLPCGAFFCMCTLVAGIPDCDPTCPKGTDPAGKAIDCSCAKPTPCTASGVQCPPGGITCIQAPVANGPMIVGLMVVTMVGFWLKMRAV